MIGLPYLQKKNYWQSQWLLLTTTNKRYSAFLVCSYNYQSTTIQPHYSCKIIVYIGSSQRSKSRHSHLHNTCTLFKLKCNALTGKLPNIRPFFKIISPSLKTFPFSAVASLNLKLNSIQAECRFCKGKSFSVACAMTSSTDRLYPPTTDLNSLILFWMPGIVVLVDSFRQAMLFRQIKQRTLSFCWTTTYFTNHSLNIHPSWRIFHFLNTTCFALNCQYLRLNYSLNCCFNELQNKYYYYHWLCQPFQHHLFLVLLRISLSA